MLFILIWLVRYVTITVTLWMGVWLVFAPYLGVSLIIFLNNSEKESCMQCPFCHHQLSKVIETNKNAPGEIRRRRECLSCGERFSTLERSILATPLVVKQDGTREEFNHEKLMQGIRTACTKRPVSAAEIERLVGEIESSLQKMGKSEVSSRVIGDMAIQGLKDLDHVAYIRYATVYLQLDDLKDIRSEIDHLLTEENYS